MSIKEKRKMKVEATLYFNNKRLKGTVTPQFLERLVDRNMGTKILGKINEVDAMDEINNVHLFTGSPPSSLSYTFDEETNTYNINAEWIVTAENDGVITYLDVTLDEAGEYTTVSTFSDVGEVVAGKQYKVTYTLQITIAPTDVNHGKSIAKVLTGEETDKTRRIMKVQLYDQNGALIKEVTNRIQETKESTTEDSLLKWIYHTIFRDESTDSYTVQEVKYIDENGEEYIKHEGLDVTKEADAIMDFELKIINEAYQSA